MEDGDQRITYLLRYWAEGIDPSSDHIGILRNQPIRHVDTEFLPERILRIVERQCACRLECFTLVLLCRLLEHPPAFCHQGVLMTGQGLANYRDILSFSTEQPVLQVACLRVVYR